MKKNIKKQVTLLLLGILPCKWSLLGYYPLVVPYFAAVFREDYGRTAFVIISYFWMLLFLPIAAFVKYGIICLIIMVVTLLHQRMYPESKRQMAALYGAFVLLLVSYGGNILEVTEREDWILPVFEGVMVFAAQLIFSAVIEWFLKEDFMKLKQPKENLAIPRRELMQYALAMGDLSKTLSEYQTPKEIDLGIAEKMQWEVEQKVCLQCQRREICLGQQGQLQTTLAQMIQSLVNLGKVDELAKRRVDDYCLVPERLQKEMMGVFEKTNLNIAWYNRLLEHRELIAKQIDGMAGMMKECVATELLLDETEKKALRNIKIKLRKKGVILREAHLFQKRDNVRRLELKMEGSRRSFVSIKEVLSVINEVMLQKMVLVQGNKTSVGKELVWYEFVSKPKFDINFGVARVFQDQQQISGDSFTGCKLEEGKWLFGLSDGMGTGYQAQKESEMVLELAERFLQAGFSPEAAIHLMNASMVFRGETERFSTLDMCLIDGYARMCEFYKVGGYVSFLRHKNWVEVIAEESLPMGASLHIHTNPWRSHMEPGEILVMITDGVLEYLQVESPLELMKCFIKELEPQDPEEFSRKILQRILLYTGGKVADDMTVLTVEAIDF